MYILGRRMLFLKADNSPEHKLLSDTTKKARALLRMTIKNKTCVAISFFFPCFWDKTRQEVRRLLS